MKKQDKPTFLDDRGNIFPTAVKAAESDVAHYLANLKGYDDEENTFSISILTSKWMELRTRFNLIYDEMVAATQGPVEPDPDMLPAAQRHRPRNDFNEQRDS